MTMPLVRREGRGKRVGGVGRGATETGGTGLALGVGLHGKPGEVGDERIDFVDLRGPPVLHRRIQGIIGLQSADLLRAGNIHRKANAHTVGPHRIGDSGYALKHVRNKERRGAVHIVEIAAIDADRGQQPCVLGNRPEVVAHVAGVEKDAAARVAALDGAVGIVPLVHPADGHRGFLAQAGFAHVDALRQVAHESKGAVENSTVAAADDIDLADEVAAACGNDKLIRFEGEIGALRSVCAHLLHGAEQNHVGAHLQRLAGEREQPAAQFDGGRLLKQALPEGVDLGWNAEGLAGRLVLEPRLRGGLRVDRKRASHRQGEDPDQGSPYPRFQHRNLGHPGP